MCSFIQLSYQPVIWQKWNAGHELQFMITLNNGMENIGNIGMEENVICGMADGWFEYFENLLGCSYKKYLEFAHNCTKKS